MQQTSLIPEKSLFRFQEVTSLTGIRPYVLRFWETEFEEISPSISHDGQKLYERNDLETILRIKKLLFEQKLSIPKAKQLLGRKALPSAPRIIEEERDSFIEVTSSRDVSADNVRKINQARSALRSTLTFINIIKKRKNWHD